MPNYKPIKRLDLQLPRASSANQMNCQMGTKSISISSHHTAWRHPPTPQTCALRFPWNSLDGQLVFPKPKGPILLWGQGMAKTSELSADPRWKMIRCLLHWWQHWVPKTTFIQPLSTEGWEHWGSCTLCHRHAGFWCHTHSYCYVWQKKRPRLTLRGRKKTRAGDLLTTMLVLPPTSFLYQVPAMFQQPNPLSQGGVLSSTYFMVKLPWQEIHV